MFQVKMKLLALCSFTVLLALSVATPISEIVRIEELGCWRDSSSRSISGDSVDFDEDRDVVKNCAAHARSKGHTVFAVQYGVECRTSADAEDTYQKYGKASNCRNGRGGSWANSVYRVVNRYCDSRIVGPDNTMCKYEDYIGIGKINKDNCGDDVVTKAITDQQKKDILDTHNELRQKVAKGKQSGLPGGKIGNLKWDDTLAMVAQTWMNQCKFKHDTKGATEKFPLGVGQNLYMQGWPASDGMFKEIINLWYSEVKDYHVSQSCDPKKFTSGKCDGEEIGHFTQVIWAKTTHVGCGWIQYDGETIVACNYGPAGNMLGAPVY